MPRDRWLRAGAVARAPRRGPVAMGLAVCLLVAAVAAGGLWLRTSAERPSGAGTAAPPDDGGRVRLFDGTNLDAWQHADGSPATWPLVDGAAEARNGDLRTRQAFGDLTLHVEFWLPRYPPDVTGQARANSGVYLQDRYEIQVLDSYGDTTPAADEAAAVYGRKAPDTNAATPPQTWQTYDIVFRAARYDADGAKSGNARVTVRWNGRTVHDDVILDAPTGGGAAEGAAPGPIRLQDHGNPVRYRNIWIEPTA